MPGVQIILNSGVIIQTNESWNSIQDLVAQSEEKNDREIVVGEVLYGEKGQSTTIWTCVNLNQVAAWRNVA